MNNTIQTYTVISKIESEDSDKIKFRDKEGTLFTLWKKKKDGTMTQAYDLWDKIPNKFEKTIQVSFTESPYSFKGKDGNEVSGKHKNVVGFYWKNDKEFQVEFKDIREKIIGKKIETDKELRNNSKESIKAMKEQIPDWDAIAEGKVRHGVAIAFIEQGKKLDAVSKKEMNSWVNWIMNGDKKSDVDKFNEIITEDTGSIYQESKDEIDLSKIPF